MCRSHDKFRFDRFISVYFKGMAIVAIETFTLRFCMSRVIFTIMSRCVRAYQISLLLATDIFESDPLHSE